MRALRREDLPTFERPRKAISGCAVSSGVVRNLEADQSFWGVVGDGAKKVEAWVSWAGVGGVVSQ